LSLLFSERLSRSYVTVFVIVTSQNGTAGLQINNPIREATKTAMKILVSGFKTLIDAVIIDILNSVFETLIEIISILECVFET